MGNEAVRQWSWKLVHIFGAVTEDGDIAETGPRTGEWDPFGMSSDLGESKNLAAEDPGRVRSMARLFEAWTARIGVVPRKENVKPMQMK